MKTKSEIELEKRVAELVQELALSGLKARACEQTNEALDLDRKKLEAEVARLQNQLSQRSTFHTSEAYLKALAESRGPTDEPKDTLTSVIWPSPGLTPEQFAAIGGLQEQLEHERRSARECNYDTKKYWQDKYQEAVRLHGLQLKTASDQVASLQKKLENHWPTIAVYNLENEVKDLRAKLENARGSADGWVADIESSLRHWKDYAGKLEAQLKLAGSEVSDLKAWKESALAVMNQLDLQEIGKELELPLGTDISPNILPGIRALKAKLEGARARAVQESQENKRLSDELIILRQKIAGVQQVVFGR